jgi:hypothetical protein
MPPRQTKREALAGRYVEADCGYETPCWVWQDGKTSDGYASVAAEGSIHYGHRLSYEVHVGSIPGGLCVLHHCDNPPCLNPLHLFLGTKADNSADMAQKGRARGGVLRGEANPHATLTADRVRAIRRFAARGVSDTELGQRFGLSRGAIYSVVARRTWAHVV